ncbi:hypothetical protein C0992_010672, partial [Termitomyces sp. T32_za158]
MVGLSARPQANSVPSASAFRTWGHLIGVATACPTQGSQQGDYADSSQGTLCYIDDTEDNPQAPPPKPPNVPQGNPIPPETRHPTFKRKPLPTLPCKMASALPHQILG